jgi:phosphatidyl-myo-inositol alpha-mannosyltransferase
MKIGFVLDDGLDAPDGVQQYILTVGSWFVAQGHEVHYLVGQTERRDIDNVHSLARNISVRFNKNRLGIPLFARQQNIISILQSEQFDVLHVQMPYSPQFAGRVIRHAHSNTAIVGTFHILPYGYLQTVGSKILSVATRKSSNKFDQVIAVSPAAQKFAHRTMGIQSSVVPNAVNLQSFRSGKRLIQYDDGKQNIVFLGRLVERKGCMELLRAVHRLIGSNRFRNRRLIICGTGPLKPKIDRYIQANDMQNYVVMVGRVTEKEKPHYLATADVAVFPSMAGESFGIVLVEAIASGASVVIGGDNPGYTYVLGNNQDVLINPRDTTSFANKIDDLLSDSNKVRTIGLTQRNLVQRFDVDVVGKDLLALYKATIAKKRNNSDNKHYG